jgi:hypothetical protein
MIRLTAEASSVQCGANKTKGRSPPMFDTTIAGSLPKPAGLEPNKLGRPGG